jgi:RluA family pseudouridine synthase
VSELVNVLYEDNHLLVVDKPAGLLVQGGDARDGDDHLVARAAAYLKEKHKKPGNVFVGLVHRLDRNTSGVLVLARTSKAAERLSKAIASRAVDKTYLAVVAGHTAEHAALEHHLAPTSDGGSRIATPLEPEARLARLRFTTLARTQRADRGAASLIEVALETGRKHQIRVQLAAVGHPLLGDRRYAPAAVAARFHRPALHAYAITLDHPVRRERLRVVAPIPPDFSRLIAELGMQLKPGGKNVI